MMRDQQREEFMKRKVEQLAALQQQQRQNQMRTPVNNARRMLPSTLTKKTYSPSAAKTKWKALEKKARL